MRQIMFWGIVVSIGIGACVTSLRAAADPAPSKPKTPTSIFDFGLEPAPNTEPEKENQAKPEPAAPSVPVAPADSPRSTPPGPTPSTPAPAASTAQPPSGNSSTHSDDAKAVLDAVHIDAQGVMTADRLVTLKLHGTEGVHYVVSGDFYPAAEPTPSNNGGINFYLRQLSGKKRMELSLNGMRVKRLLYAGEELKKFASPMKFEGIEREQWHSFKIDAGRDVLTVQFDQQKGEAKGPLEMGGSNVITLGPGAKLRHVQVTIEGSAAQAAPAGPAVPQPVAASPAGAAPSSVFGAPSASAEVVPPAAAADAPTTPADPAAVPEEPLKSPLAASALTREKSAIKHAEDAYRENLIAAKRACVKDLDAAMKSAMQGGNLDEANKIAAVKKRVSGEIDELNAHPGAPIAGAGASPPVAASNAEHPAGAPVVAAAKPPLRHGGTVYYISVLGKYYVNFSNKYHPFVNLSVPDKNIWNEPVKSQMRAKVDFKEMSYKASAKLVIPIDSLYTLDAKKCGVQLNGKEIDSGDIQLKKGIYDIIITSGTHGGDQMKDTQVRFTEKKSKEVVPLVNTEADIKAFMATAVDGQPVAEVSGWKASANEVIVPTK